MALNIYKVPRSEGLGLSPSFAFNCHFLLMYTMGTMDDNGSSTWVLSLPAILRDVDGVLVSWFRVVQLWLLQTFGK